MTNTIIALAIGAIFGFASAYQIQQHRIDTMEKAHAETLLATVQQSAAENLRLQDQVAASQNAATARLGRLRNDASSSRTELERLRLKLHDPLPAPNTPPGTCPERADTSRELLIECGNAIQALAERADRHASDVEALIGAWPK